MDPRTIYASATGRMRSIFSGPDHSNEAAYQSGRLVPRRMAGYSHQGKVDSTLDDFDTRDVEADVVCVDHADTPPASPKGQAILRVPPEPFEELLDADTYTKKDVTFTMDDEQPLAASVRSERVPCERNGQISLRARAMEAMRGNDGSMIGWYRALLNFCSKKAEDIVGLLIDDSEDEEGFEEQSDLHKAVEGQQKDEVAHEEN